MEHLYIPYTATTQLLHGNVLVLAPHPDDEVFGCGGAIMQHVAQGDTVRVLILTDGAAAIPHPDEDSRLLYITLRQQESQRAAQILGYGQPEFWEFSDRALPNDERVIQRLQHYLTQHHIHHVYAPSTFEIHPDHLTAAHLAVEVVKRSGGAVSLSMYEVGMPLHPNCLLDLTPFLERKQQAMQQFGSQLQLQHYEHHILGLNHYRAYTLSLQVTAAEAYYVIDGETLQTHPAQEFGHSPQTLALEHAQQRICTLEGALAQQKAALSRVYQSYSWQITQPLRCLRRWWRGE